MVENRAEVAAEEYVSKNGYEGNDREDKKMLYKSAFLEYVYEKN